MLQIDRLAEPLFAGEDLGVVIAASAPGIDPVKWMIENRQEVERLASLFPVVLLRGFDVHDIETFGRVRDLLIPEPASYVYRSTPRTAVGAGILTTTEYPASQEILLHCENAYQRDWPMRLMFGCMVAAETGGQTPYCDIRRVTARIGSEAMEKIERLGVQYIRNYHQSFDLDWRVVFQTESQVEVEEFCSLNGISCEWLPDGHLRTVQVCQGTAIHPKTGDHLWFNQAHLFHPSALGAEAMEDMVEIFGLDNLPRNARYGDGSELENDLLERVRDAYAAELREFDWQVGDITIVDNMLAAHGRRPFTGSRRVLVSFGLMASSCLDVD